METRDSSYEKEDGECAMEEAEHKRANLVPEAVILDIMLHGIPMEKTGLSKRESSLESPFLRFLSLKERSFEDEHDTLRDGKSGVAVDLE